MNIHGVAKHAIILLVVQLCFILYLYSKMPFVGKGLGGLLNM